MTVFSPVRRQDTIRVLMREKGDEARRRNLALALAVSMNSLIPPK